MRGIAIALCVAAACGGGDSKTPDSGVTTELCNYQPLVPTANAGGTVTAEALQAGVDEEILDVPVGTALGGYTARAGFLGAAGVVDARKIAEPGVFNPSIGVITAPRVKALALTAGPETVLIIKVDFCWVYEGMLFDLEQRLGPEYAGKIILAGSHTHSGWSQYQSQGPLKLGSGEMRELVYNRFISKIEEAARAAIAKRKPAKLGVFFDGNFDPTNQINHDRRGDNDMLPGGDVKDNHFYMIRVDGMDDKPIAAIPIFGEHGTLNGEDNPFASTDAPGAIERVFEEQFDSRVLVMHLQSAGGDNSPTGHGGIDCNVKPGKASDPCFSWATEEGHGRAAVQELMAAWQAAGSSMKSTVELEMLTKSVETGPDPKTFTIRDGALAYAPFDRTKTPDGKVYDEQGNILSPIDEFNAPVGAGLCESETAMFPAAAIPGTEGIKPYGSCLLLDQAAPILGDIFDVDLAVDETHPVCETTRTTISALRIGDYVIGTMPGELTVMLAEYLRSKSPVPADHTILVSYAQGHMGYLLRPEDWLQGGYEPSVTFWGPLAAEYVGEQLLNLMPLALTPMREDASMTSATRVATATVIDNLEQDDPAPMAGTIPTEVPPDVWARTGHPAQAQPAASIPRVSGIATFVWIGDDPKVKTPHVQLERETSAGVFEPVLRRSGRPVEDQEILLAYTPEPLQRSGPQTHVWVAEWQAVPWLGAPGRDSLDDRGGVPTGNYRFHVDGDGWSLDSDPFDVVPGGLEATATRSGQITATVTWHARIGWRLMDMNLPSNQPVPVRSQQVSVTLVAANGVDITSSSATTDANGVASVADNANAAQVRITDRFGNVATAPIN
jgi:neutral ceramidase